MPSARLLFRFITVGGLVLLLLVPLAMIGGLVHERQAYRDEAVARVAQGTAGAQGLVGPLRVVPYTETVEVDEHVDGRTVRKATTHAGHVLQVPRRLSIDSDLVPDTRKVGLH
jgi:inner membrane protein